MAWSLNNWCERALKEVQQQQQLVYQSEYASRVTAGFARVTPLQQVLNSKEGGG